MDYGKGEEEEQPPPQPLSPWEGKSVVGCCACGVISPPLFSVSNLDPFLPRNATTKRTSIIDLPSAAAAVSAS